MKLTNPYGRLALIGSITLLLCQSLSAQEKKITAKDVPAAVINAFKTAYPNAIIRGYAREKEHGKTFYEIESREGTTGRDVLYHPDGTVAEVEETIAANDLPAAAREMIHARHPQAVITKVEKTTVGDKVTYEVSARQGRRRFSLEFDSSGKVMKGK